VTASASLTILNERFLLLFLGVHIKSSQAKSCSHEQ
jgi:hypothetical protein